MLPGWARGCLSGEVSAVWSMKRWFWVFLVFLLLTLQYRLWVGEGSLAELWQLKEKGVEQEAVNARLRERNELLKAEVTDLKQGLDAIEERARTDLGMIKEHESFYQLADPEPAGATPDE